MEPDLSSVVFVLNIYDGDLSECTESARVPRVLVNRECSCTETAREPRVFVYRGLLVYRDCSCTETARVPRLLVYRELTVYLYFPNNLNLSILNLIPQHSRTRRLILHSVVTQISGCYLINSTVGKSWCRILPKSLWRRTSMP